MVADKDGVIKLVPVPKEAPPLAAAYQFNVPALVVAPRVTVPTSHLPEGVVPETVGILIVATTGVRAEVQLLLVASTKNDVVVAILGVLNVGPAPRETPPVGPAYQFNVPPPVAAPSETVPAPQRVPGVVPVMVGIVFTVATTAVRAEGQPLSVTST